MTDYERGWQDCKEAAAACLEKWKRNDYTAQRPAVAFALTEVGGVIRSLTPAAQPRGEGARCVCGHARENHYHLCSNVRLDACAGAVGCQCSYFQSAQPRGEGA